MNNPVGGTFARRMTLGLVVFLPLMGRRLLALSGGLGRSAVSRHWTHSLLFNMHCTDDHQHHVNVYLCAAVTLNVLHTRDKSIENMPFVENESRVCLIKRYTLRIAQYICTYDICFQLSNMRICCDSLLIVVWYICFQFIIWWPATSDYFKLVGGWFMQFHKMHFYHMFYK